MYVAIERKPESGYGIQNSAYGKSGVVAHLDHTILFHLNHASQKNPAKKLNSRKM